MKKIIFLIPLLMHFITSCSVYQNISISSDDKVQLDSSKSSTSISSNNSHTYYYEDIKDYSQIDVSKYYISANVDENGNEYTYNFPDCPTSAIIHTKHGLNNFISKYPKLYETEKEYFDTFSFEQNSIFLFQYKTDYNYKDISLHCSIKIDNALFTELSIDFTAESTVKIIFNIFTTIKKCHLNYSQLIVTNKEICDIKRLTIYGD